LPVALAAMEEVIEAMAEDAEPRMELARVPVVVTERLEVAAPEAEEAADELAGAVAVALAELALPVAVAEPEADEDPQRLSWRAVALASSSGQVLWMHWRAACWKAVLEQTQVKSVKLVHPAV